MQLAETKAQLAKLLAAENLKIEFRAAATASFNTQTRVLVVPTLKNNISPELYDLFVGHEVGHALYTPIDMILAEIAAGIPRSVGNVIDDFRIERKMKTRYPGLRRSFIVGYQQLLASNFFGTDGKDLNTLNFADRMNLHHKCGATLGINFSDRELEIIKTIEKSETIEEHIDACKVMLAYMREQLKNQNDANESNDQSNSREIPNSNEKQESESGEYDDSQEQMQDSDQFDDSAEDQEFSQDANNTSDSEKSETDGEGDSETSNGSEEANSDSDAEDDSDVDGDEGESDEEDDAENPGSGVGAKGGAMTEQEIQDALKSETDEACQENMKSLLDNSTEFQYANIPYMNPKNCVVDHKDLWQHYHKDMVDYLGVDYNSNTTWHNQYNDIRKELNPIVSYLAKEFELRKNANQLKRASTAKTGELNLSKVFSYQFNEDIFKKMTVVPEGKSHGLVMFLDWSGSMQPHMKQTMKQLFSLVMFCKKVSIPFEVYAFSEHSPYHKPYNPDGRIEGFGRIPFKCGDLSVGEVHLLNILSSRMTASEFANAGVQLIRASDRYGFRPNWFTMFGTPLNEAIIAAMEIVPAFQRANKLQVVNTVFLTDGEGTPIHSIHHFDLRKNAQSTEYFSSRAVKIIRDPKNHREQEIRRTAKNQYFRENHLMTSALLKALKARTGCNVIGFFVLDHRSFRSDAGHLFGNWDTLTEARTKFRKENYLVVDCAGYDEYYLLRTEGLNETDDEDFDVEVGATTKKLVKALTKYSSGRIANRVVLNRFIGLIA